MTAALNGQDAFHCFWTTLFDERPYLWSRSKFLVSEPTVIATIDFLGVSLRKRRPGGLCAWEAQKLAQERVSEWMQNKNVQIASALYDSEAYRYYYKNFPKFGADSAYNLAMLEQTGSNALITTNAELVKTVALRSTNKCSPVEQIALDQDLLLSPKAGAASRPIDQQLAADCTGLQAQSS